MNFDPAATAGGEDELVEGEPWSQKLDVPDDRQAVREGFNKSNDGIPLIPPREGIPECGIGLQVNVKTGNRTVC